MVKIPSAISAAPLSSVMESRKERTVWLDIKLQTEFFHKQKSISHNTSFMPLAFNVITYEASVSEDIYFYF